MRTNGSKVIFFATQFLIIILIYLFTPYKLIDSLYGQTGTAIGVTTGLGLVAYLHKNQHLALALFGANKQQVFLKDIIPFLAILLALAILERLNMDLFLLLGAFLMALSVPLAIYGFLFFLKGEELPEYSTMDEDQ